VDTKLPPSVIKKRCLAVGVNDHLKNQSMANEIRFWLSKWCSYVAPDALISENSFDGDWDVLKFN
jgi:hypothetical protein